MQSNTACGAWLHMHRAMCECAATAAAGTRPGDLVHPIDARRRRWKWCPQAMLAIGSAMLGAAHVLAVDCDADALEVAADNCDAFEGIAVSLSTLRTKGLSDAGRSPRAGGRLRR